MNYFLSIFLFVVPLSLPVDNGLELSGKREHYEIYDAISADFDTLENKTRADTLSKDTLLNSTNSQFFDNVLTSSNLSCGGLDGATSENQGSGFLVLKKGFELVESNFKMSGSCWSYANKLYDVAGFTQAKRKVVYDAKKGTLLKDPSLLLPGDWLFHVNYSFRNVEHSAIFVCWKDKANLMAITLSHVGQNKYAAGRFGVYDLKGVYRVTRAIDVNKL